MKRWWGIRHIRHEILARKLERWISFCQKTGLGIAASRQDIDHLNDVWEGRA